MKCKIILFTLFFLLITTHYSLPTYGAVCGIDVSKYQGYIDWERCARDGRHKPEFMYAKASQGTTIRDETYRRNMMEARRAGVLVGSYHFFSEGGTGREQADYFIKTMEGIEQDLIPVIDVERCPPGWGVMGLRRNLQECLNRMEQVYGVRPIIYTGVFFYNMYLAYSFDEYPLFLARYGDTPPMPIDERDWLLWQFSSTGQIAGIRGNVDLDYLNSNNTIDDILLHAPPVHAQPRYKENPHIKPNTLPTDAGLHS